MLRHNFVTSSFVSFMIRIINDTKIIIYDNFFSLLLHLASAVEVLALKIIRILSSRITKRISLLKE